MKSMKIVVRTRQCIIQKRGVTRANYKSRKENPQKLDSVKSQISSKTSRGKKDSTKRRHQRHHKRQPGEQLFPIQVGTG